jgi:DNA-binding transcriptional regulator YiaG
MFFSGRITKDGSWWLAEVPLLDVMTQGRTRRSAIAMLADAIETLVARRGFKVRVVDHGGADVSVAADDVATLFATALKRLRAAHGLSIADVAKALGQSSKTAYARYEQGVSVPTLDKAGELLRAVAPDRPVVIGLAPEPSRQRRAARAAA